MTRLSTTHDPALDQGLRAERHPTCPFCANTVDSLVRLPFERTADGVSATFSCDPALCGYQDMIHGGIIAGILDAAMTNALFARDTAAATARLEIRYPHPLRPDRLATVTAEVVERTGYGFTTCARIIQEDRPVASARATFIALPIKIAGGSGAPVRAIAVLP